MRWLSGWLLLLAFQCAAAQTDPFPGVAAAYLVEVDGKTLWGNSVHSRLPPASLTKVMTALLVLERYQPEAVVTVNTQAAQETGSRLGLRRGDRMRMKDLLAAMLLNSANDACHALSAHVAGNHERFVALMNERARELGLVDTHFTNACGHDAAQHYSSAHDLASLAGKALQIEAFANLVAKKALQIANSDGTRTFQLENKNALIGRYAGAAGIKTGYTRQAGKCLIAFAQRKGSRVLLVMLNAPDRWWGAAGILDQAFSQVRHAS